MLAAAQGLGKRAGAGGWWVAGWALQLHVRGKHARTSAG